MASPNDHASEHYLQVIEARSRVFRIMYDTIMAVEGSDDEEIYRILSGNLRRICNARLCAFASCESKRRVLHLRALSRADGDGGAVEKIAAGFDRKFEDALMETQVRERPAREQKEILEELLQDVVGSEDGEMCALLSCVREGELLAVAMVYMEGNEKLKMKDLLEVYMKMAGMIIQRMNALTTIKAQARELEDWNRELQRRVEDQLSQLQNMARLKRFVSPQIAELIVSSGEEGLLQSHRRNITVVFCDLRGFTAFSETVEPEEVMGVLREYHAAMGTLIFRFEGTLERFSGDGVMVFFNDPLPCQDPAAGAVRMAVAMRESVSELSEKWRKRGHQLDFGVGIAQGYATLGKIGFEGRFDYAAIGTVTNLASRLCDEAQAGQVLISERVYAAVEELADVEPVGELALKGLHRPVTAYNVLRLKGGSTAA